MDRILPEAMAALQTYLGLLRKWNPAINLVSARTLDTVWERHFLDSAQVFFASGSSGGNWCDLGSGAGFPGLVIAVLLKYSSEGGQITLIEADGRKAAFLSTVSRELDLPCSVVVERIEKVPPQNADWVAARALAPLDTLLGFCARHLAPTGVALLPKGRAFGTEVEVAKGRWSFGLETIPSLVDAESVILRVTDLKQRK